MISGKGYVVITDKEGDPSIYFLHGIRKVSSNIRSDTRMPYLVIVYTDGERKIIDTSDVKESIDDIFRAFISAAKGD